MEWIIAVNTSVYKSDVIIHAVYHNNNYGQSQGGIFCKLQRMHSVFYYRLAI